MARVVCLNIPQPVAPLAMVIPGVGAMEVVREFTLDAYSSCMDARIFINSLQPLLGGLGLPLCVLSCVTSITQLFTTDFPFVNPSALTDMVKKCLCLTTFSPFGFCSMILGLTKAIYALLSCIIGLMSDVLALETQALALLTDPTTAGQGRCIGANAATMRETLQQSFGPVSILMDSTAFLFEFVGVTPISLGSLDGGSTAEVIESARAVQLVLANLITTIGSICP
jgi:hypothetical protein